MKHLSLVLIAALAAPLLGQAQVINTSLSGATGGGTVGNATFSYDASNASYWVQFGVDGSAAPSETSSNISTSGSGIVTFTTPTQANDGTATERTQNTSGLLFEYNNGTNPTSSTSSITSVYGQTDAAQAFSVQTGYGGGAATTGQSLTFTITFAQAVSDATINVAANVYNANSTVQFSFSNGATESFNDPDPVLTGGNSSNNDDDLYSLSVSDISAGSVLTVTDTLTTNLGGSANVSLSGFSIDVVPEPSTYAMLLVGAAALVILARRQRILL